MTSRSQGRHVGRQLRDGDPMKTDQGLSMDAAAAMRRRMLASVAAMPASPSQRPATLTLAAALTVAVVLGVGVARNAAVRDQDSATADPRPAPSLGPTQLRFATPGGTRIIWTLDPSFKLGESTP